MGRSIACGIVIAAATAGSVVADSSEEPAVFPDIVGQSRLVVLARVGAAPPLAESYRIEIIVVLKGSASNTIEFPSDPMAVELDTGSTIVLCMMDEHSLDFRGTTVFPVTASGIIVGDHVEGVPPTIADLYAWFGLKSSPTPAGSAGQASLEPTAEPSPSSDSGPAAGQDAALYPAVAAMAVLAIGAVIWAKRPRPRSSGG